MASDKTILGSVAQLIELLEPSFERDKAENPGKYGDTSLEELVAEKQRDMAEFHYHHNIKPGSNAVRNSCFLFVVGMGAWLCINPGTPVPFDFSGEDTNPSAFYATYYAEAERQRDEMSLRILAAFANDLGDCEMLHRLINDRVFSVSKDSVKNRIYDTDTREWFQGKISEAMAGEWDEEVTASQEFKHVSGTLAGITTTTQRFTRKQPQSES